MTAGRICRRDVDSIEGDTLVRAAAQRMSARNVGTLLVLDSRKRILGLVTDRDLALRVVGEGRDPQLTRVRDVMSPDPATVSTEASVNDALRLMRSRSIRRLPVIGEDGAVVGVVSMDDIVLALAGEFSDLKRIIECSSPQLLAHSQAWSE